MKKRRFEPKTNEHRVQLFVLFKKPPHKKKDKKRYICKQKKIEAEKYKI